MVLTSTTIDLLQDLCELAGDMSGVAIENWGVSVADLSRVVEDDDLSGEILDSTRWLVFGVGCNISTPGETFELNLVRNKIAKH